MGVAYTVKMGLWESNISVVLLGEAVESRTPNGESPVAENITSLRSNPSNMGHVEGRVPLQTIRAKIGYCYYSAQTIYGILGIKGSNAEKNYWFQKEKTSEH